LIPVFELKGSHECDGLIQRVRERRQREKKKKEAEKTNRFCCTHNRSLACDHEIQMSWNWEQSQARRRCLKRKEEGV
jgi:hypothetical protein